MLNAKVNGTNLAAFHMCFAPCVRRAPHTWNIFADRPDRAPRHLPGLVQPWYRRGSRRLILHSRTASAQRLFCAVGAIASISQAWDNEPSLIESIVDGRSPKTNIGIKPTDPLQSFLSGNQTDKTDVLRSALLDTINGSSGCIAGSQHRSHDDHETLRKIGRSFKKIFDCNECLGIAVKPDMRNTCSRH